MIDQATQDALRRKYNPEGSELRKLQNRMLEMLVWIDCFCKQNGIRYWITAGTLLGAVRHGGFIPWDDDVDICMPQKDYERFVRICSETDKYVLQTPENDFFYTSPYAKLRDKESFFPEQDGSDVNFKYRGVFIDIFCVEHCPFILSKLALHFRWRLTVYAKKLSVSDFGRRVFGVRKRILFGCIGFARRFTVRSDKGPLRLGMGTGFLGEERFEEDIFPLATVSFEGYGFSAPGNSDVYLRHIYGDYLTLPAEDTIHPHSSKFSIL